MASKTPRKKPAAKKKARGHPKVKIFVVKDELAVETYTRSGRKRSNDDVRVGKKAGEHLTFINNTGTDGVDVTFDETPFDEDSFGPMDDGASATSSKVRKDAECDKSYKYTVSAPGYNDLDPNVIVDP